MKTITFLKSALAVPVMLLALLLTSNITNAQTPIIDGNPSEWPAVISGNPTGSYLMDYQNSALDDIWTGGSSDVSPISSWAWKNGSANDKNDMKNTGIVLINKTIYFFADRYANNGDSQLGIWIMLGNVLKNATPPGFTGEHTDGDILLRSHFVNGGGVTERAVYIWEGGPNGGPVLKNLAVQYLNFASNSTTVPVPAPWEYTPKKGDPQTYPENSFVEGFIDLEGLAAELGVEIELCYASFLIETGNSQSISSSLEDLVSGSFGSIPDPQLLTGSTFCSSEPNTGIITMAGSEINVSYQLQNSSYVNMGVPKPGTGNAIEWTGLAAGTYYILAYDDITLCENTLGPVTVNSNNISPGVIAGNQTLCSPFDPVAFTSTTPGTGGGTISYQWQMSTTSAVAGFANIGGATLATYDAGVVSVPTWFRRVATSTLNDVPCADNSNVLLVSPNAIVPGVIAGSQTLCSPFDPVAFTSTTPGSGGGTISYQWQMSTTSADAGFANIGGATLATYDAGVVSVPTWFRRVATSTLNDVPCADNSNVLMVSPNAIVPGVIAGSQTLCSPFDPVAFTSTTPGSGGGTISYQWQMSTTSAVTGFANIVDATLATYDAGVVAVPTWFRRVATSTLNDVPCADNSNVLMVTPNAIVPGVIAGNQTICEGEDAAAFTSTTPGSGSGTIAYQWQSSSDGINFDNIVGATNATYDEGILNASMWYKRLATSTLNDVICEATSNIIKVTTEPCGGPLCTYTQGYYGNAGGMACTPDGQFGTLALIQKSITEMGGTLYIGRGSDASALGGSFTLPYAYAQKIIDIMPGGGAASVLASDYNQTLLPPLKNGKISNGLLSQTIALAINLYMADDDSESVGEFVLEGGKYLVTAKKSKTSSCDEPEQADCIDDPTAINSWWIPANVVNALPAPKNVWTLFQFAKDALGGATLPMGVKLSEIQSTVDAVNNAFDGRRFFLRYSAVKESCPIIEPTIAAKVAVIVEEPVVIDSSIDFKVYPVPYEDVINVSYRFEYGTDVTIQVFNLQGGFMYGVVDNRYNNGEVAVKQISLPRTFDQALIIRLTTNKEKLSKTIVAKSSTQR